ASNLALKAELMEKSPRNFSSFRKYSPQNNTESSGDKEKSAAARDSTPGNKATGSSSSTPQGTAPAQKQNNPYAKPRKNLFKTHCSVKNKVCDLIIDNGSTENLVSQKLVNYFKLPAEPHEKPYALGWVSKGSQALAV
ncbi:hypothetical protein L195_g058869, partial [Trifolium pratense]